MEDLHNGVFLNTETDGKPVPPQRELLAAMRDGAYRNAMRLPPEVELAAQMRISRTQLRDALSQLEREGYITRRHGVGTLINRHVLELPDRMDMEVEFSKMIEHSGKTARVEFRHREVRKAEPWMCRRLGLPEGSPVLSVQRVVLADEKPCIFCDDMIPYSLIRCDEYGEEDYRRPIFDFLRDCCGEDAYMDLTRLRPAAADAVLAEVLQVEEHTPLLRLEEVDYDIDGRPILLALQHFTDGPVQHWIMRKRF